MRSMPPVFGWAPADAEPAGLAAALAEASAATLADGPVEAEATLGGRVDVAGEAGWLAGGAALPPHAASSPAPSPKVSACKTVRRLMTFGDGMSAASFVYWAE
ncbi:MAG: hypothetical protein JO247_14905 [Chloroflexi bacterium]|nr:hypothetical protein [Chloroflexota bacterium]